MADLHASADALLTEHLRYTPLSLIDDIINTVNTIVYRALSAVENGLLGTPAATLGFQPYEGKNAEEVKRIEVEDGVHRLETLLEATVDKNFDKLEIYALRNILCLDTSLLPWVRLGHYKDLDLPLPSSAPTPASIHALREQLQASESLSIALEAEAAATQNMLTQMTNLVATSRYQDPATSGRTNDQSGGPLSFLMSSHSSSMAPAPVTENAAFAASQLPALRALLASIRPAIAELRPTAKSSSHASGHTDAERIARRAYVDSEVQRAVRGAVGLVSDDGENADLQRGIAQSNVLALEAAMAARKKGQQ